MKWVDMLTHVLPSAPGCPESLAIDHLVKAARTYCAKTLVWNYETQPFDSTAGLARYTLQIAEGQALVRLLTCEVGEQTYDVPAGLSGRAMQRAASGYTCVIEGINDFVLEPAPHLDGLAIVTDIAVKPALTSPADWPDDLEEHVTALADGALSTLLALPGVSWKSKDEAIEAAGRFADRMGTVAFKVSKGFGRSRHGAKVKWF